MRKTVVLKTLSGFIASILVCISLSGCGVGGQGSSISGESSPADSTDVPGSDMSGSASDANGDGQADIMENPAYSPMGRQVLTAVVTMPFRDTLDRIQDFNESNPSYFVEIKEYGNFRDPDAAVDLETQLTLEILSGDGPDVVIWGYNLYTPALASEKLMEDLNVFMEADPDFHREDYYENILQAFERDGGLYLMPVSFNVQTVCGRAEELGSDRGIMESWELGEMLEAYENSPRHAEWFSFYFNRELTLRDMCTDCLDNFVDWDRGECCFDTPEFMKVLEFCKNLPDGFMGIPDSMYEAFQNGEVFLYNAALSTPWIMAEVRFAFQGDPVCWPGYPVANGEKDSGGVAVPWGDCFSICRNSSNPEGAWEFIKSYLTAEVQRDADGIPLLRSASEERIEDALTIEYETVDGVEQEKLRYELILTEHGDTQGFSCITQEEADLYRSLIESVSRSSCKDSGIMEIIEEEAGAYFENDKDAAAVADTIQHRVSVYVSERM